MYIIIGATGFIGMYTVRKFLQENETVLATGRNKEIGNSIKNMGADFLELDITNEKDFEKLPTENVEGVIVLASLLPANIKGEENPKDYFKINVNGVINILEYCRKNGIKKVINCTSYSDVSGYWKEGVALTEETPRSFSFTGDHAVYVISKNAISDVMEYYNQQYGMQCAWFRLPPVYGVGPHSVIYKDGVLYKSGVQTFIDNAKAGKDIEIWGNPHIKRDIIYVKDVATAFYLAVKSEKTLGLYNMTSGTELDLETQIKTIIELFSENKKSKIIYCPEKKNNTPSFLFDMSKAKNDFGFIPKYTSYRDMMIDYKNELENHTLDSFLKIREK